MINQAEVMDEMRDEDDESYHANFDLIFWEGEWIRLQIWGWLDSFYLASVVASCVK